jgi:hypothetical protein
MIERRELLREPGMTPGKLRYWAEQGLIEEPLRDRSQRGRPSLYPDGTLELVRAYRPGTGPLPARALHAWCAGLPVPQRGLKAALDAGCRDIAAAIGNEFHGSGDPMNAAFEIVLRLTAPASQSKPRRSTDARALRALLGESAHDVGMFEMFSRAVAAWQPVAPFELTVLSRALGIERLRSLAMSKTDQGPSAEDLTREALGLLGGGLATGLVDALAGLEQEDLERARDPVGTGRDLTYALVHLYGVPADDPVVRFLDSGPKDWRVLAGMIVGMAAAFKRRPQWAQLASELAVVRITNLSELQLAQLAEGLGRITGAPAR